MDFNQSVVLISARSPFARRVRLALLEHGIRFEERVFDVFRPNPDLIALNPLARVPVVQLADGTVLTESEKILAAFYETQPRSPLRLDAPADRATAGFWAAVAVGLCEKSVEYYLESLRPESARDPELLVEIRDIVTRSLERFERFIGPRSAIAGEHLSQADLDMGTALTYLSLRYSSAWMGQCPQTAAYLARLEERPSFRSTRPPA